MQVVPSLLANSGAQITTVRVGILVRSKSTPGGLDELTRDQAGELVSPA